MRATGDRVRWLPPEACPCGRPFAGIEAGTVARYDQMLKIKLVNVWPDAVDAVVLAPAAVLAYQGEVRFVSGTQREDAIVAVECRSETPAVCRSELLTELGARLHERLGLHFTVAERTGPSFVGSTRDDMATR